MSKGKCLWHISLRRKTKEDADAKQYKAARDSMRKNELRIQKDKMKKYLHNQQLIEILLKLKYNIEDSFECFDILGKDLTVEEQLTRRWNRYLPLIQKKLLKHF